MKLDRILQNKKEKKNQFINNQKLN